jgi:hypothetical protein
MMDAVAKTAQEEARAKAKTSLKTAKPQPANQSTTVPTELAKPLEVGKPRFRLWRRTTLRMRTRSFPR